LPGAELRPFLFESGYLNRKSIMGSLAVVILRKKIAGLSSANLERFVLRARRALNLRGTVDVIVTSNSELRALNRRFRGKDKPTDVLSFPSLEIADKASRRVLGDVAISIDIARQNAARLGHPVANELRILILHGLLHVAGWDHERDNGAMARKEKQLRIQLKLESGLIEREQPCTRSSSSMRTLTRRARA
jgi:probable rRNA maturation factor